MAFNVAKNVSRCSLKWINMSTSIKNNSHLRELAIVASIPNKCTIISGGRRYCSKSSKDVSQETASASKMGAPTYKHSPSLWDKRILVWTKKYPSVDQVPEHVSRETMDKARNKARIYTNLLMGAATILACIAMIISGKRAAKRGESVQKMNVDWHKKQD